jgi:hypothetical protein
MTDNIWGEIAYRQEQDEQVNCDIIFQHELYTIEPKDLGRWFHSELKLRQIGDQ